MGTEPAAATRSTSPRGPTSAPWSWSSRSAPSANTTGLRTISGHRSRLSRSQPATRTSDPAATARTCTPATAAAGPVSSRGAMRTSTSPPQATGRRRGRNTAVNSPPRLAPAAVTHSQAPPAGGCRPARASTSTSSSATSPSGTAHPWGSPALRGAAIKTVSPLSNWQSGWPRPGGRRTVRTVSRARSGGPGRNRRPRSALCSRRPVKPEPACSRLRQAGLDTARGVERGYCRSRAEGQPGRPFGTKHGLRRSVRQARAVGRRPGPRPRPAAGPGRGAVATVTQAMTASALPQPARKPAEDAAALIRPAGQAPPAPGQRRRASDPPRKARGKPAPKSRPARK